MTTHAALSEAYRAVQEPALTFGAALDSTLDHVLRDSPVRLPIGMLNRHGLVAGATGTGKTKTLQVMAEQLSDHGVPVLLADLKGDLSGLSQPGEAAAVAGRVDDLGMPWEPRGYPVRFLSLDGAHGERLRVPMREFGPLLLAKVMNASNVQESVLQVVFLIAESEGWALDTLADLQALLRYLTSPDGRWHLQTYGGMSTGTLNVLLRNTMAMQAEGLDQFFGIPPFDVTSLQATEDGRGVISIVDLSAVQTKPRVFSSFLMWLLQDLYEHAPEVGDADKPRLVFFFDEAHLLFEGASAALVERVRVTVRMIRSKGIGVFFVTQHPTDLPDSVLSQLGCRVQHALRAFTPKDQQALKATASTFPVSSAYDVRTALTSLGTGEALVTGLTEDGDMTPTAATRLMAPQSSMDPVDRPHVEPEPLAPSRPVARTMAPEVFAAEPEPRRGSVLGSFFRFVAGLLGFIGVASLIAELL